MLKETDSDGVVTVMMTARELQVLKDIVAVYFDPRGHSYATHDAVIDARHRVGQDFLKTV